MNPDGDAIDGFWVAEEASSMGRAKGQKKVEDVLISNGHYAY